MQCSVPDCPFRTEDVSENLAIALLTNHGYAHTATAATHALRGPKLERPKVDVGVTLEEWNVFVRRWNVFKSGSGIDNDSAPSQLFQCAGPTLGDNLLKTDAEAATKQLPDLLAAMRSLAVIPVATGVLRADLLHMHQERDEPFRAFAARVRGKAETCAFKARCTCGNDVNYTDHSIRDVLLSGISDLDIRREVLGTTNVLQTPVNDVIALVESKEMARNALPLSSLSAVSSFRHQQKEPLTTPSQRPPSSDRSKQVPCPDCKKPYHLFREGVNGWNTKPHSVCLDCYRAKRRRGRRQGGRSTPPPPSVQALESGHVSQIAAQHSGCASSTHSRRRHRKHDAVKGNDTKKPSHATLNHHVFTKGAWRRARLRDHPKVTISISMDTLPERNSLKKNLAITANVQAVADSGAQSDLWSLADYLSHGFTQDALTPVSLDLSAANRSPISIEGAFFAHIETQDQQGKVAKCRSMVYVSKSVQGMYLSLETMINLGILGSGFPNIGKADEGTMERHQRPEPADTHTRCELPSSNATRQVNDGCLAPRDFNGDSCPCPQRSVTPPRPSSLPFDCTPENNSRMKTWLLERYASSTFNTCPHRALPCMEGPPVEIHIDPSATPKAYHTAATIPLHWQDRVHDDLLRDEALGVIERVPYGEPVTWCHRMVITRKHDGSPRRTVDLSPLNKFCKRETFATESPFHLARRIPKNTWKTVTDAWNGYHSVPLRESDRHLTTFITPFGRWRYTRAPQGFLSSGDGYNRRFDAVLASFVRHERCVDDTVHYDSDLEQHWWRTIDFLTCLGQAGIVLNPDKFQFAEKTVDFAGFRVSDSSIEPLPKYLDAIRDFPTPTSTTDIRSWFGLVNQVGNYAQLRNTMAPFKPFLSPRHKFSWSAELDNAFKASKEAIITAIRHGVEIFDMKRRTCLRPDWSCQGIGYFVLQKHCNCPSDAPDCCPEGWRVTLAGSRFLSSAEQRYAPIEGEALAVAWGLEQSRYFTQGCDNLLVVTDHKPLVKIFGDRTLDEITNTRLFRLKQRTLPWRFDIMHMPGKANHAADATSRHPSPTGSINSNCIPDYMETVLMGAIQRESRELTTLSWSDIAQETARDPSMSTLLQLVARGVQDSDKSNAAISPFWTIRDSLYIHDGVILYNDRVIIPPSLRESTLRHLHAAHQGTSAMEQRARATVYWPGMTKDIHDIRNSCSDCNRNAPSQAAMLPIPSNPPSTPFEAIFADFFQHGGHHYLVVGDRLSGWVEVFGSTSGTHLAGASGLVRHLRTFFATFGVPEELSSDGGPEFSAGCTQAFLSSWGVQHRMSSAHFPQSNGRAEVAVKKAKRLLMSNTGPAGSLDHDRFLRGMLQLRNTPDPDCNVSPAQIVFGRPLRDALTFVNHLEKFSNPNIRPLWRKAWMAKEDALRSRITRSTESLSAHARPLQPLTVGDKVFIQNQHGNSPTKWDKSGTVMESIGHDQYWVKVDGSGRLTLRNRRFLRVFTPATPTIAFPPDVTPPCVSTPAAKHAPATTSNPSPTPTALTSLNPERQATPSHIAPELADRTSVPLLPEPEPCPASPICQRSRRTPQPRRIYEPETGRWIEISSSPHALP